MARDFLTELLEAYWFAPSVALWRAVELRTLSSHVIDVPHPVLDLGCGDGLIGGILFPDRWALDVGLDPWLEQVREAATSGVYRHVDQAVGNAIPYADGTFATVFSNSVLEHIRAVQPVLQEVARVLRPGGRFVFTVPSDAFRPLLEGFARRIAQGDPRGADAYAATVDRQLEHHHYYSPEEWRKLLSTAGLRLAEASYYIPEEVAHHWDRMNRRFGHGQSRTLWSLLASPRFRLLGYQALLRGIVVKCLSQRWRAHYEMNVPAGSKGSGMLVVARL